MQITTNHWEANTEFKDSRQSNSLELIKRSQSIIILEEMLKVLLTLYSLKQRSLLKRGYQERKSLNLRRSQRRVKRSQVEEVMLWNSIKTTLKI